MLEGNQLIYTLSRYHTKFKTRFQTKQQIKIASFQTKFVFVKTDCNKLIPYLMTDPENILSITLADIAAKGNIKDAFNEIQF